MKNKLAFIALLALTSCHYSQSDYIRTDIADSNKVVVDISEAIETPWQRIDDFIENIKIIPLETNDLSSIAIIKSVKVGKNNIFIVDSYSKGNVAIFDKKGKFLKRLSFGNGPEDHLGALSIKFNSDNNQFLLMDSQQSKIIKYDEYGNYINHYYITTNFITDFAPVPEGFLLIQDPSQNSDNEYRVILNDTTSENTITWSLGKGLYYGLVANNFYPMGEVCKFQKATDNTIYYYRDKQIEKKFEIKYGNTTIDYSKYERIRDIIDLYPNDYFQIEGTFETKDWLRIRLYSQNKICKSIFVNKTNFKSWSQDIRRLPDYFTSWMEIIDVADAENNVFVGLVDPTELTNSSPHLTYGWDGSNPNNLISPEDMEKLKSVKEDDNPIIVLFKLKDDI